MAGETVAQAARMIVDTFVDQQNKSDLEGAFGADGAMPSPAMQQLIQEHAVQHGLKTDDTQLLRAIREELEQRSMARRA